MSGQCIPGSEQRNPLRNETGSTTRLLLLLLLLVVAAAGYLYYFTDIIKPRQEAVKPAAVQSAPVKQPIPPRPEQPGGKGAAPAQPAEGKPPQAAPAPTAAQPQAKGAEPKPAPAPPPAKPEPVKTAKVETPAKPAPPPAPAKPAAATPPAAQAPAAKKEPAPAKTAPKVGKTAGKKKGGPYRLLIGDFVPDKTFDEVLAKMKKSGIAPVRKSAIQAAEPMHRLYVAEFADQDEAETELSKLRKLTADAFLIYANGKYLLYAGSYLTPGRAASEMKKLGARGVKPVIRKAQVTIKVTRVTAGSYASGEEARKDAARLKKQGIHATVVKGTK